MPPILTATDINVRYNERVILDQASLTIDERDRIGMVGRNGSGKSTFLRILTGLQAPDGGELSRRRDLMIGYMPQQFELDAALTVAENIRAGARVVLDLIQEFESLPATSGRHDELEHRIQALDGWGLDNRIETAMAHLNCPAGDRHINTLSGGEQRRVALCRALISRPDLLVLDEPTNHLDTESIEWLGEYLENYPGAFLMVTHDRYFLDQITNRIVEVAHEKLQSYSGNYTDYLLERAERDATAEVSEHKRQMFLRRELAWVRKGPSARRTKSKDRMERYFEMAGQAPPEIDLEMDLVIPPPPPLGNRTVELVNLGMELGGKRLFSGLSLNFAGGQRVGITGRNGLGKTTLLRPDPRARRAHRGGCQVWRVDPVQLRGSRPVATQRGTDGAGGDQRRHRIRHFWRSQDLGAELSQTVPVRGRAHHRPGQALERRRTEPAAAGPHLEEWRQFSRSLTNPRTTWTWPPCASSRRPCWRFRASCSW